MIEARRETRSRVRVEVGGFADVSAGAWDDLAEASGNVFATREWLTLWWRYFGRGEALVVRAFARDGRLLALTPLYRWSTRPLRVVRFLGHGSGEELGPVAVRGNRVEAAQSIRAALAEIPWEWDVLVGELLPGGGWDRLVDGRLLRRHRCPVLRLRGQSWESFLATRSRHFRQQVRWRERRLARDHALRFRLANEGRRLDEDLDLLFELHAARWNGVRSAFGGAREAFQREFAWCALERGWLRLWFLELDDAPVAAWYGFRFGDRASFYQSGRDPKYDTLSVGSALIAHSIRAALEEGVCEYRFLQGDEAYKYRFTIDDPGLETVALAGTPLGRLAVAGAATTRCLDRLPAAVRGPLGL
jgi:CelD/BcsL family acetyltransferase involved in cellulose biosynthesis